MSKKLADFIVENRACSVLDDKIRRFYRRTKSADFRMKDDRFLLTILLADKIDQLYRSSDIPCRLSTSSDIRTEGRVKIQIIWIFRREENLLKRFD